MSLTRVIRRPLFIVLGLAMLGALPPAAAMAAPASAPREYIVALEVADSDAVITPSSRSARQRLDRRAERAGAVTDRLAGRDRLQDAPPFRQRHDRLLGPTDPAAGGRAGRRCQGRQRPPGAAIPHRCPDRACRHRARQGPADRRRQCRCRRRRGRARHRHRTQGRQRRPTAHGPSRQARAEHRRRHQLLRRSLDGEERGGAPSWPLGRQRRGTVRTWPEPSARATTTSAPSAWRRVPDCGRCASSRDPAAPRAPSSAASTGPSRPGPIQASRTSTSST